MLQSISPYALLCASKPRREAPVYAAAPDTPATASPTTAPPESSVYAASSSAGQEAAHKRTRYISGIAQRHSAASQHASWMPGNIG